MRDDAPRSLPGVFAGHAGGAVARRSDRLRVHLHERPSAQISYQDDDLTRPQGLGDVAHEDEEHEETHEGENVDPRTSASCGTKSLADPRHG